MPLRWQPRCKALLTLLEGEPFQPDLDEHGLLQQIQLDMGQVISATPHLVYTDDEWAETYNNLMPVRSERQVLVEYTAHPDACFISARRFGPERSRGRPGSGPLQPVKSATRGHAPRKNGEAASACRSNCTSTVSRAVSRRWIATASQLGVVRGL
jgi:hypothetical protein